MHQIQFQLGAPPQTLLPAGGAYSAPQTPYLDLRGLLLREGRGKDRAEGGQGSPLLFFCRSMPMHTQLRGHVIESIYALQSTLETNYQCCV